MGNKGPIMWRRKFVQIAIAASFVADFFFGSGAEHRTGNYQVLGGCSFTPRKSRPERVSRMD
jgi:hypothetical protein